MTTCWFVQTSVLSKEEVLKDLRVGDLQFKEIEVADVKVRIHGDNAIFDGTSRITTSRRGKEANLTSDLSLSMWLIGRPRLVHFQSVSLATEWGWPRPQARWCWAPKAERYET